MPCGSEIVNVPSAALDAEYELTALLTVSTAPPSGLLVPESYTVPVSVPFAAGVGDDVACATAWSRTFEIGAALMGPPMIVNAKDKPIAA